MKKTISLTLLLSIIAAAGFAQGFYVRAGLGYAFPLAGEYVYNTPIPYYEFASAYNGTRTYNSNGTETYNIKNASLSSGFQSTIGFGYMFTENIGFQLDAGIGLSNTKYTFTDQNVPLSASASSVIDYNVSTVQQAKTPFLLMPSLVLQTSSSGPVDAYTRFGLVLPLNTKVNEDQIFSNAPGTGTLTVDDFSWHVKSSFSLGFTAAAGVKYKINDRLSIWGELSILSMSLSTKEQDLKSWTENGQSVPLVNFTGAQTIKFSKTATFDTATYASYPPYAQPFSNVGLNFGITYRLSKQESARKGRGGDDMIDDSKPFRRKN